MITTNESFPEMPEEDARWLAEMFAAMPTPADVDGKPPSEDFIDGFNEFRMIAVAMVLRAGGVKDE